MSISVVVNPRSDFLALVLISAVSGLIILGPVIRSELGPLSDLSLFASFLVVLSGLFLRVFPPKNMLPLIVISLLLASIAALNALLVAQTINGEVIRTVGRPLKGLLVLFSIYLVVELARRLLGNKRDPEQIYDLFVRIIFGALTFQAVLIAVQFVYPPLGQFTHAVLFSEREILAHNMANRMPGLAGAGGAPLSALQGIGFLLGCYLCLKSHRPWLYVVPCALLIISVILTGRTGMLVVFASCVVTFAMIAQSRNARTPRSLLKMLGFFVGPVVLVWVYFSLAGISQNVQWILQRSVEDIVNTATVAVTSGEIENSTIDELSKMLILPESPVQMLIGDARLFVNIKNGQILYPSDIGYIRIWFAYGVIGVIMHVFFYLWMGFESVGRRPINLIRSRSALLGASVVAAMLILNYKEPFFFTRMVFPVTVFLAMAPAWLGLFDRSSASTDS